MRAVLVPAADRGPDSRADYPPLGLLSLHQVLTRAGHDCRIFTPQADPAGAADGGGLLEEWAAEVLATEPDWVGLSASCDSYPHDLLLARTIKERSPRTCVVLGGPQASAVAEETMAAFTWIDFVIRGEAEGSILPFTRLVEGKLDAQQVPGLTYRAQNKILSTPLGPLLEEMDSLHIPDYGAYPRFEAAFTDPNLRPDPWLLPLEAGRGCPYACVFCSTSAYWHRHRRQKSPRLLAQQAKALIACFPVDAIIFEQDLFAVEGAWLAEFLQAMEEGQPVPWRCQTRTDSISPATLRAMHRAGCKQIFFGVESGSQRSQALMQKNLDVAQAARIVEAAIDCGMQVSTAFIVGFPWETGRDLQDTLSLHKRFLDLGVHSRLQMLHPLPGTQITLQYAGRLRLDPLRDFRRPGLGAAHHALLEEMILRYPLIFTDYYYLEPEAMPREEFLIALWAANCLQMVTQEPG